MLVVVACGCARQHDRQLREFKMRGGRGASIPYQNKVVLKRRLNIVNHIIKLATRQVSDVANQVTAVVAIRENLFSTNCKRSS